MLGPIHKLLIEVILNIKWTDKSIEITTAYKKLIEDLMCMHIYHSKLIIDKLVYQLKSGKLKRNYFIVCIFICMGI